MGYIILAMIAFFIILSLAKKLLKLAVCIAIVYFICIYFFGFNLQHIIGVFHF
ncbi:hypothetical protein OBV_17860 [Oscillibacter valericigenes Sjm18-20]|nr:hypothetical protein OBV_17860 [Oscillibacter valericigenes Sjm18-20]